MVGLLLRRDWRHFRGREIWLGGGIAAVLFLPYENDKPIWVCREPRLSLAEAWPGIASFS